MYLQSVRVFGCAPARSDQGHLIFLFLFPSREKEKKKHLQCKRKEKLNQGKKKKEIIFINFTFELNHYSNYKLTNLINKLKILQSATLAQTARAAVS
jgi:hypothetical protein